MIKFWEVWLLKNGETTVKELKKLKETAQSIIIDNNGKRVSIKKYLIAFPQNKKDGILVYVNAETEKGATDAAKFFYIERLRKKVGE